MQAKDFQPPKPVGEPFRGDPNDPVPFATEGSSTVPAQENDTMTPWMTDSTIPTIPQGPPSHSRPGPPSLGDSQGDSQRDSQRGPQFRQPAPQPPRDPKVAQRQRVAKFALISGIASIFILWPLFGPIAIGLGIHSIRQGERKIGAWALSTGIAGTLIGVVVTILVIAGVVDPDQLLENLRNRK